MCHDGSSCVCVHHEAGRAIDGTLLPHLHEDGLDALVCEPGAQVLLPSGVQDLPSVPGFLLELSQGCNLVALPTALDTQLAC